SPLVIVVRSIMRLPGGNGRPDPSLGLCGMNEHTQFVSKRMIHRFEAELLLHPAGRRYRLILEPRRAGELEIAEGQLRHRMIGKAGPRFRHPMLADRAMRR